MKEPMQKAELELWHKLKAIADTHQINFKTKAQTVSILNDIHRDWWTLFSDDGKYPGIWKDEEPCN